MIIIGITFLLLFIGLSGCEERNQVVFTKDDLIGTWNTTDGGKFVFYTNNSFYMQSPKGAKLNGSYNVSDNILFLSTFLNQSLKINIINPNKIKLKIIDSPGTNPLILIRKEM